MAACNIRGVGDLKLYNFRPELRKTRRDLLLAQCSRNCSRLRSFSGLRGAQAIFESATSLERDSRTWRLRVHSAVLCSSEAKQNHTEDAEAKSNTADQIVPGSFKVQSLLTAICDTTSIAEVELKLGDFRVYVKRDLVDKSIPAPPPTPSLSPVPTSSSSQAPDSNGSASASSLAISKPRSIPGSIQSILETASDEGLVIIQSPKVGFFRTSRTIKGKRAPPSCKEKQEVKEGQVLCYVEQLGGEIPIESDISGEVIKILRTDGEPVGYGDALVAILPSFPGIKKLQ